MQARYAVALSVLVGFAAGGAVVQGLHAQAKPPAYIVAEIDVQKPDEYAKDYVPNVQRIIKDGGGKYLASSNNPMSIDGTPPKRLTIIQFENIDKAKATFTSEAYRNARKTGEKYAKFRITAVEGVPQ